MSEKLSRKKESWYVTLADYCTISSNKLWVSLISGFTLSFYKFRTIKFEREINSHFNSPSKILNRNLWNHHIKDTFLRSFALCLIVYLNLELFSYYCASEQALEKRIELQKKEIEVREIQEKDKSSEIVKDFEKDNKFSGKLRLADSSNLAIHSSKFNSELVKSRNKVEGYIKDNKFD